MGLFLRIMAGLYGILSVAAAAIQLTVSLTTGALLMVAGGALLLVAVGLLAWRRAGAFLTAFTGCALISAAALSNGLAGGAPSWAHHALRLGLSAALLVGFWHVGAGD